MKEIGRILAYDFVENLTKEQLKILKDKSVKNVLIYDYLIRDNPNTLNFKKPIFEQILQGRYNKPFLNEKKYFGFKTPKKMMVLNEYKKHLSNNLFNKFHNLNTQEGLKQLYCFDEIYSKLNQNRKEKIDFSRDISSTINFSIGLYTSQLIVQEMTKETDKFKDILDKVNYANISLDQIKYLKSRSKTIEGYIKREPSDFEIKERIQDSKEIIREANKKLKEGIDKRFREEFKKNLEYFEYLNKKDFLSYTESINLKTRKSPLSELESILNHFGDSRANDVSNALKKYTFLISSHDYFCKHKNKFGLITNKQRKLNRKIKRVKLRGGHSLFEFIKRKRIRKCLTKTEINFTNLNVFYDNRYFKKKFDDEKEDVVQEFKSLKPNKNWPEKLLNQYEILQKCF